MTTRSSRSWDSAVAAIRRHSEGCHEGGPKSFDHFEKLVGQLLCITVCHEHGGIISARPKGDLPLRREITGRDGPKKNLIKLNDGHWLKLVIAIYFKDGGDAYLRSSVTNYQYQHDQAGKDWVFRYEYLRTRETSDVRPMGHLHVCGKPEAACLPPKKTLKHVHFACGRPTLEGVIKVLADEFNVPTNAPGEVWRPVLRDTESIFQLHAHPALI